MRPPVDRGRPSPAPPIPVQALLVGHANVGKSTLFNTLTGSRQRVANAPGTTVCLASGEWRSLQGTVHVIDLPGTPSLIARSPDEDVVAHAVHAAGTGTVAIVVADATAVDRSLYLLGQVADAGCPVVLALTMIDRAHAHGLPVEPAAIAAVLGIPVVAVDVRRGDGLDELAEAVVRSVAARPFPHGLPAAADRAERESGVEAVERVFTWVARMSVLLGLPHAHRRTRSDAIDRILLRPWLGVPVFLGVMWVLFELATRVAVPIVGSIAFLVDGPADRGLSRLFAAVGLDNSWVESLVVEGLLPGLGTVAAFLPVVALVLAALSALEQSGYLARAAVVADRAMRSLGLDGRAILPLVIGFGCNVPAVAATLTLPDARQRRVTGLLVSYATCSARLPVFLLLAVAFFPSHAGLVVFGMYVVSAAMVVTVALVLKAVLLRGASREALAMALPEYQRPSARALAATMWRSARTFATGAGRVIVLAMLGIWMLLAIPARGDHRVSEVPVADSAYGVAAEAVTPILAPLGLDDWRVSAALVSGFVAKEVVVGALGESFAADDAPPGGGGTTQQRLRVALDSASGGHGSAAALAFMVFVLAYTPCLATLAEQRRLFGWRWALAGAASQTAFAWIAGVLVFQLGRLL